MQKSGKFPVPALFLRPASYQKSALFLKTRSAALKLTGRVSRSIL